MKSHPDFYKRIKFDAIPKVPWLRPTSSESIFLLNCHAANNPEIYYRMLIVSFFRIPYLYTNNNHSQSVSNQFVHTQTSSIFIS